VKNGTTYIFDMIFFTFPRTLFFYYLFTIRTCFLPSADYHDVTIIRYSTGDRSYIVYIVPSLCALVCWRKIKRKQIVCTSTIAV